MSISWRGMFESIGQMQFHTEEHGRARDDQNSVKVQVKVEYCFTIVASQGLNIPMHDYLSFCRRACQAR